MCPIFLRLGPLTIHWYGVCAALGFLSAYVFCLAFRRRVQLTADQIGNVLILSLLSGIAGARIFYVLQNFRHYAAHPEQIIRIDQGGLVFYGGFLLALAVLWLYSRRARLDLIRIFDLLTPALPLAHAWGRLGCFLNGCCFGKPTELWCGVHYPEGSAPALRYPGMALHPVQLYEALLNVVLAILMTVALRKCKRGVPTGLYFLSYGILRFIDEYFRGDHLASDRLAGFSPAQVIGFGLIPAGALLLLWFATRKAPNGENHRG